MDRQYSSLKWLPLGFALGWLFFVWMPDLNQHWLHPEYVGAFLKAHGPFDYMGHDNRDRCRFLSYFFSEINMGARAWLGQWMPVHPSASVAWIFGLLLTPWMFFLWCERWTQSRETAIWATSFYLCSSGFVSGVTLLFHPGKPLSQWMFLLLALLALDLEKKWSWKRAWAIWVLAVLNCFFDESGAFGFLLLPILTSRNWKWTAWPVAFRQTVFWWSGGVAWLALVTWVAPVVTGWAGFRGVDFWSYAGAGVSSTGFGIKKLFAHVDVLFGSYLVPFEWHRAAAGLTALWILLAALAVWVVKSRSPRVRAAGLGCVVYLLFHAAISNREPNFLAEVRSSYYYGAFLPFFLSVLLGSAWVQLRAQFKFKGVMTCVGLVYLMLFVSNTYAINRHWIRSHEIQWQALFPQETKGMDLAAHRDLAHELTWEKLRTMWQGAASHVPNDVPIQAVGLWSEMKSWKH